ncbi:DJ-1/PfpI family protein [Bimuria novae-zelandiae CBS 107.79]|uniref:DJ-1/PfpI family protein n=1 Tax=Bimuria novae-zelandiae CBS 107.79 TaxID=1447943 RepID=A0A6A5UWL4_9PLEO|nr:DJ-1/PfpI family protein [Bimuria novae-zelandiae CBS 107.79]
MTASTPDVDTKPLRIGVLYENVQLTDLAGLDIIGNMSTRIFDMLSTIFPSMAQLKPFARDMEFLYISSSTEPAWATPDMYIRPTHTYDNTPRDLDIILVGGPDPSKIPEASVNFLREASTHTKAILATCSGGMWLASSGILDGKKATTNRLFLEPAKKAFPKVEWLDERWVTDDGHFDGAQIWTSGGAKCGIDMVIEYALHNFHEKLVATACGSLEFEIEGRRKEYSGPFTPIV